MFNYKISFAQKVSLDNETLYQVIDAMHSIYYADEVSENVREKFSSATWDVNYRDFSINLETDDELEAQEMVEAAVWFSNTLKISSVRITEA